MHEKQNAKHRTAILKLLNKQLEKPESPYEPLVLDVEDKLELVKNVLLGNNPDNQGSRES